MPRLRRDFSPKARRYMEVSKLPRNLRSKGLHRNFHPSEHHRHKLVARGLMMTKTAMLVEASHHLCIILSTELGAIQRAIGLLSLSLTSKPATNSHFFHIDGYLFKLQRSLFAGFVYELDRGCEGEFSFLSGSESQSDLACFKRR
jgi:hypothetical protein